MSFHIISIDLPDIPSLDTLHFMDTPNLHNTPGALEALQADIYREKILRARKLTVEQRLADVFELSNHQFGMMLSGAMHKIGTRDVEAGWSEVARWMERLDRVREHKLYSKSGVPLP